MLILLPPSEGKTPPVAGPHLDFRALSFPELTDTRRAVASSLQELCTGPIAAARKTLGVSERLDDEIDRNAHLLSSPCAQAGDIYTGVLFESLGWNTLTKAQRTRAGKRIAIASALFGLVRPIDLIPAYRLSANTTFADIGTLRSVWSTVLPEAIATAAPRGVVVDMRSSAYVALGPVPAHIAERTAVVRVLQQKGTKRVVVSHHNKATKGRLTRSLLGVGRVTGIDDLAGALGEEGYRVEVQPGRREVDPWTIDVVVDEV